MREPSKILHATIGLIGVLITAVPVSSQDGYFGPVFADRDFPAADKVELLPPVELIPLPVPQNSSFPAPMYPIMAARPRDMNPYPAQPMLVQPLPPVPARQIDPSARHTDDHAFENNAFENLQTPQADMILGPELLDPILTGGETCVAAEMKAAKIWSGNVEFGLNGTEGNSQTFNIHIGASTKRKTKRSIFTADLDYNKKNNDSINTANRLFCESRLERPHSTTPWTWYMHGAADYDEFQPWNLQINGDTGIGYQIVENDSTDLTGRFGGGCSQEIGGPNDAYVPELLFGMEFEHRRGERHKFKISVEYFPDVTDFTEYRMVDKASWEILLDSELNLSLSFNVIDTINHPNPGGKDADLDYSAVLLWNF